MSDRFEQDPEETAKILRAARERESQVWGNKVATADVTPAMIRHVELPARCICDACAGARPQAKLPVTLKASVLVNRHKHHRLLYQNQVERPEIDTQPREFKTGRKTAPPTPAIQAPPGVYSGRFGSRLWG